MAAEITTRLLQAIGASAENSLRRGYGSPWKIENRLTPFQGNDRRESTADCGAVRNTDFGAASYHLESLVFLAIIS
jgi:hypothetical protein